jgi:N4-gp56 family major capsid protein
MAAELVNQLVTPMLANAEFDASLESYIFEPSPLQNAKTIQWNRMERLGVALAPAQLTEGVAAQPVPLTINSVTATMEEYGNAVYISSLSLKASRNNLVQDAIRILGYNVKETRDRLLYAIADAATNVFRVNDRADDNATEVGDFLSFEEVSEVKSALAAAGTPKKGDGFYHLVTHSRQYSNLETDANWLAASQFAYADDIRKGRVNMILGVVVHETNSNSFAATVSTTAGNSSKIRSFFIAGAGAAKVSDLVATQMHTQAPGTGSDWQGRRAQLGWTATFKGAITNQDFIRRGRASSIDATAV